MAEVKNYGLSGVHRTLQLGKQGPVLVGNADTDSFTVTLQDGATLTNMSGANAYTVNAASQNLAVQGATIGFNGITSVGNGRFLQNCSVTGTLTATNATIVNTLTLSNPLVQLNGFAGTATLVAGTIAIANTNILSTDLILVTRSSKNGSTNLGYLEAVANAGVGLRINSYDGTAAIQTNDNSIVSYMVIRSA